MQPPSSSPRRLTPKAPKRTRSVCHCQSFLGAKPWQDSPPEAPEYTSLKDIIPVMSTSPPSYFWERIPLTTTPRRRPRPCTCSNVGVFTKKRKEKKVAPADEDDEAPLFSYPAPPPPRRQPLCSYPKRLCMQGGDQRQISENCITCVIWEKMFEEVKQVFSKITDGIGKLFTSMRVRKHGHSYLR